VLVGLGLPLALEPVPGLELALALVPGLTAMKASSEAETVAEADAWDDDGEAEPVPEGELVPEGEPVPAREPDTEGEGDAGVLVGVLLGLELDAGAVAGADAGELEEEEDDGEGGGDDGGCGVGVGVGEGVLAAGSTWHLVSVFAPALLEVPGLGEAAPGLSVPARAAPGQAASTPRVRRTPVSRLRTAARTCTRRIKDRPTRRGYCVLYVGFGGD
jgi:hypothetical protein